MSGSHDPARPKRASYHWPVDRNFVTRDKLRDALSQYSREPFGDVLEALLQARPSTEQLLSWAAQDPAQWANAIKVFALLNGYTEKTESLSIHKHLHLHRLSDAELIQATQEMISNDPSLLADLRKIDNKQRAIEEARENPFEEPVPAAHPKEQEIG